MHRSPDGGAASAFPLMLSGLLGFACGTISGTADPDPAARTALPGTAAADPGSQAPGPIVSPQPATLVVATRQQVPDSLQQALSAAANMDGSALQSAYPPPAPAPVTRAADAAGMDLIMASALELDGDELLALDDNGLVISSRHEFPSFAYGYKTIYSEHLPLYVSADSILEAVHRSFDGLLQMTETSVLIEALSQLLDTMRANLKASSFDAWLAADVDVYLTLAASLLRGQLLTPVAGGSSEAVSRLYDLAVAAHSHGSVELFGVDRDEDFSQFAPRGHYTDSELLSRYFRAMTWLGRVDLRMIETRGDGSQVFMRRQFDAALALNQLLGARERALWEQIDSAIGSFTGEHDSMTPKDMAGLLGALQVSSPDAAAALSNQQILDELTRGGWGEQRIASRIIMRAAEGPSLPLDRSFLLFGQRYTVDSNTFVNVSYDRVQDRLMPEPLDVAFAALGNNAALPLLSDEFANRSYTAGLAKTRALVDAHESTYWEGSLYTRWLGALRSLSPRPDRSLANIVPTAGWNARILATQLGSWAELRHDTILYAKQSYTASDLCEFPDAYVDPYPEFYARLGAFAEAAAGLVNSLPAFPPALKTSVTDWSLNFQTAMGNLRTMAEDQLSGAPHSPELLAFINDAVNWDVLSGCGGTPYETNFRGWYLRLYLTPRALEEDPVVADVHTQPTDRAGADVGRILHVGTGRPRLMVVTANTCQGTRAYAGLAFSYGELVTENWRRLTDEDWAERIRSEAFPDVPWLSGVIAQ